MWSWWCRLVRRGHRRRRFVWANGSAWANPLLVCAMAGAVAWVPLGLEPSRVSAGSSSDAGAPPAGAPCLALPSEEERTSCLAAQGEQTVAEPAPADDAPAPVATVPSPGGAVPPPVVACLSEPSDEARGSCFAAMGVRTGGVPARVARCLALPAGGQRSGCFAGIGVGGAVPERVAGCLALPAGGQRSGCFVGIGVGGGGAVPKRVAQCVAVPAGAQRRGCFAALRGPDRVLGDRVARCLARPGDAQRASCLRRAFR